MCGPQRGCRLCDLATSPEPPGRVADDSTAPRRPLTRAQARAQQAAGGSMRVGNNTTTLHLIHTATAAGASGASGASGSRQAQPWLLQVCGPTQTGAHNRPGCASTRFGMLGPSTCPPQPFPGPTCSVTLALPPANCPLQAAATLQTLPSQATGIDRPDIGHA